MVNYNPKIAQGGLVIDVDAANPRSYPGTGSIWYNIAPERTVDGAMTTGVTFAAGVNGGAMLFSGSESPYSVVTFSNGAQYFPMVEYTTETWLKSSGMGVSQTVGGIWSITYGYITHLEANGSLSTYAYNSITTTYPKLNIAGNYCDNNWHQIVTMNDGYTNFVYIDGVLKGSLAGIHYGSNAWSGNQVSLGINNNNINCHFNGYIAQARLYKRALSDEEVWNNFCAYRGRFGI